MRKTIVILVMLALVTAGCAGGLTAREKGALAGGAGGAASGALLGGYLLDDRFFRDDPGRR